MNETTMPLEQDADISLKDQAYDALEEMIVTLMLPAGSAISEAVLAKRLGMSRTPVREALQRLSREGLIRVLPRRGLLVTDLDVGKQLRMLEVRRVIDRLLAERAAAKRNGSQATAFRQVAAEFAAAADADDEALFTRADRTFNDLLLDAAGNEFAAEAASLMQGRSRRFWFVHQRRHSSVKDAAALHSAIAHAIADQNVVKASTASDALLDHVEQFTRATLTD
jgi:DNA-binding GntR family transcriptional regulator